MWDAPRRYSGDPFERGGGAYNFYGLMEGCTTVWRHWTLQLVEPSLSVDCFNVFFGFLLGSGGWRGLPSLRFPASRVIGAL